VPGVIGPGITGAPAGPGDGNAPGPDVSLG